MNDQTQTSPIERARDYIAASKKERARVARLARHLESAAAKLSGDSPEEVTGACMMLLAMAPETPVSDEEREEYRRKYPGYARRNKAAAAAAWRAQAPQAAFYDAE